MLKMAHGVQSIYSLLLVYLYFHAVSGTCTPEKGCECGLSEERVSHIESKISASNAYMFAIPNMRCTIAGRARFQECGIELEEENFHPADIASTWSDFHSTSDPTWKYMNCKYPVQEGGMVMHSYVFVDGQLKGDGFDLYKGACSALEPAARSLSGRNGRELAQLV
mmetsp:Transcript_26481/g.43432  ORF Transcript_26481/g.43432 Transcript_26481/m.43432 type:complete len:166 (-) Transcript_26481:75-572(-)